MSLVTSIKNQEAVLRFFDTPDGKVIIQYFLDMKTAAERTLYGSDDEKALFKAQGVVYVAHTMINLKREILRYQEDVRTGKIQDPAKLAREKEESMK
jgi:hypothetical protein